MSARATAPTLRGVSSVGVEVPLRRPLGTSAQTLRQVPLLLVDLETEEGVVGRSYLFCYFPKAVPAIQAVLAEVAAVLKGDKVAPLELEAKLRRRFTLIGVQGIVRMAVAALDTAA
jgi:mandelate racemase